MIFKVDGCNINDGGLQQLGSALQDNKIISCLSIANNLFSSEALTCFLEKFLNFHSRLSMLVIESQRCKPELIVAKINLLRIRSGMIPLRVTESEENASYEVLKSIHTSSLMLPVRKRH